MNILLLVAASSFESVLGKIMYFLSLIVYVLAFILLVYGGWQWRTGRPDEAKLTLVGAAIIAMANVIARTFFDLGGLPVVNIDK